MSSADAFLLSSTRIAADEQKRKMVAKRERLAQIEQSLVYPTEKSPVKTRSPSVPIDPTLPLADRQRRKGLSPIRSRFDLAIQQATVRSYARYASESPEQTAVNCLQEAGFFQRKSWFQQVEIGKEMVKQRTKRCIHRYESSTPLLRRTDKVE